METIFMNSENSKTSDPHRLLFNLSDKINLKRSNEYDAQYLLYMEKYLKNHTKIINLKYQLPHRMKNLNDLMGHTVYQIFKVISSIF